MLVLHANWLHNRFQVKVSGLTPFEDQHQRPYRGKLFEFGQLVLARKTSALDQAKLESRWIPGVWLGRRPNADDHL
eukprot:13146717-Heterocapsa_arctica.AAC.1